MAFPEASVASPEASVSFPEAFVASPSFPKTIAKAIAAWFLVFRSLRNFPVDARATSTEPVATKRFIMVRIYRLYLGYPDK